MVKPEKFGHLHLVYHFTVPLKLFWHLKWMWFQFFFFDIFFFCIAFLSLILANFVKLRMLTRPILERQSVRRSDALLKVPFSKKGFILNFNQTYQKKQKLIRWIHSPLTFLDCPITLLWNKGWSEEPFFKNNLIQFFHFR